MADKNKLPSRHVSVGPKSAPHRAFYHAMGITEEQIKQPFVGEKMEHGVCWQRSEEREGSDGGWENRYQDVTSSQSRWRKLLMSSHSKDQGSRIKIKIQQCPDTTMSR